MTPEEISSFLISTRDAAQLAAHIWPEYAACEAALESAWGTSQLTLEAFNLFGRKQSTKFPLYSTLDLPTHEWINSEMIEVMAHWVKYPDLQSCFQDRMATLRRLSPVYPEYAAALAAPDGETFIVEVSKKWSSDPSRGTKVLAIYSAHKGAF